MAAAWSVAAEETAFGEDEVIDLERWQVGASAMMVLPQGGSNLRQLGGAAVRVGYYISEFWAVEGEVAWLEDRAGLATDVLWHWWGYERFDPFLTLGWRGWINGDVGPKAGMGAYYHLTESLSLRFDADATLGLDGDVAMAYALAIGFQLSF